MEKLKNLNIYKVSIIIGIIVIIIGIVFICLSATKLQINAKKSAGQTVTNQGYYTEYGGDFYSEMSFTTKYIASATRETFYIIERCFGISLVITGIFYILHNLKKLNEIQY